MEEFGGTVQLVHTSAKTGIGLPELTEALLLQVGAVVLATPILLPLGKSLTWISESLGGVCTGQMGMPGWYHWYLISRC